MSFRAHPPGQVPPRRRRRTARHGRRRLRHRSRAPDSRAGDANRAGAGHRPGRSPRAHARTLVRGDPGAHPAQPPPPPGNPGRLRPEGHADLHGRERRREDLPRRGRPGPTSSCSPRCSGTARRPRYPCPSEPNGPDLQREHDADTAEGPDVRQLIHTFTHVCMMLVCATLQAAPPCPQTVRRFRRASAASTASLASGRISTIPRRRPRSSPRSRSGAR